MSTQERRGMQQEKSGRRTSTDRRYTHDEYNGMERRSSNDRRAIAERRSS